MRKLDRLILAAIVFITFIGCKKDFEGAFDNDASPETYMVVDSIYRSGNSRYTTTVVAHWWATTGSGYIKGYQYSIDNQQTWVDTKEQSGTFLLTLPSGVDSANIRVYVRAIDNRGNIDPTPASVSYPVRNTAPTISFDFSQGQKTNTFPAFRYAWNIADLDGQGDLSVIEVALNDTINHVVQLPPTVQAASFVAERTSGNFTGNYFIYSNTQITPLATKLTGGVFNDTNTVYLRCIDRSGASANWTAAKIFVKRPQSGILFINDYNSNKNTISSFYSARMSNLGAGFSAYDQVRSFIDEFPSDAFTTTKALEFFNRIVWVTDDPTRSLGTAQLSTVPFFNNGGRIFFVLEIPYDVSLNAGFFSFTPIEKLVDNPGRSFKMSTNDLVIPYQAGWPTLKASSGIINTLPRPFITFSSSSGLYNYDSLASAQLRSFGTGSPVLWTGPSNVMAKRNNAQTGKTDMVTLTVPLHLLNANNNVDSFFYKVVVEELKF